MLDSGTPVEYLDSLEKAQAADFPASGGPFRILKSDPTDFTENPAGPLTSPNTVAQLQPKQAGQVPVIEPVEVPVTRTYTVPAEPSAILTSPQFDPNPLGFDESANEESGQYLTVEESIELLFDLYEDISDRITSFENRLALHNTRASHKI